jgi:hypothetical protein
VCARRAACHTWTCSGLWSRNLRVVQHSLAVLLQIYAKCLVGQEEVARRRIDAALGGP